MLVKLITSEGRFNYDDLNLKLSSFDSRTTFNSVAIIGSEGKGKSTILNAFFSTNFETPRSDRREVTATTRGVDLAVSNDLIILDVEGFDTRPREEVKGVEDLEKMKTEERVTNLADKLALFVLLATDLIIINVMSNDISTYNASGMAILETILKATKQLEGENKLTTKKTILFFIRDVDEEDKPVIIETLEALKNQVYVRIRLNESELVRLIDIKIHAFPHFKYCKSAFFENVQKHKHYFTGDGLFRKRPKMPCSILARTFQAIWETVSSNEELNLPDVRSLKNIFQLKEIKAQQIQNMQTFVDDLMSLDLTTEELEFALQTAVADYETDFTTLTAKLRFDIKVTKSLNKGLTRLCEEAINLHLLQQENATHKTRLMTMGIVGGLTIGTLGGAVALGVSAPASVACLVVRSAAAKVAVPAVTGSVSWLSASASFAWLLVRSAVAKVVVPAVTGSASGYVTAVVTNDAPQPADAQVVPGLTQDQRANLVKLLNSFLETGEEQTLNEMQAIFDQGTKIDANALKFVLSEVTGGPGEAQIVSILQEADKNYDGLIDLQEFSNAMKAFRG
jgi:hypothetical protein